MLKAKLNRIFPDTLIGHLWLGGVWYLLLYQICRVVFYLHNETLFENLDLRNILLAIGFESLRVDLAMVFTLQSPFLILAWFFTLLQVRPKNDNNIWTLASTSLFFLFNLLTHVIFIGINLGDAAYYGFTGRRSSLATLDFAGEAFQHLTHLLISFWPLTLMTFLAAIFSGWLSFRQAKAFLHTFQRGSIPLNRAIVPVLFSLLIYVFFARGGTQLRPISSSHVYSHFQGPVAALVNNSTITFLRSVPEKGVLPLDWVDEKHLGKSKGLRENIVNSKDRPNLILIVMESFSLGHMKKPFEGGGWIPFFESLANDRHSKFFPNHFANGRRSIDAVPSLLGGLPNLMDKPFAYTMFMGNDIKGVGHRLSELGYSTSFFHGGSKGTMLFDSMAALFGINQYFAREDYTGPDEHDDGAWGIFDRPFFKFFLDYLNGFEHKPFFSVFFSLSSHNPFRIEKNFKKSARKGTPFQQSLLYADHALKLFFDEASKAPWFDNTIFLITGDHTARVPQASLQNAPGAFRVPLVIFSPSGRIPSGVDARVTQHADIPETLLHLAGSLEPSPLFPFSTSVFNTKVRGEAFYFTGNRFYLTSGNASLAITLSGSPYPAEDTPLWEGLQNRAGLSILDLKSRIQEHHSRLLQNKLQKPL